jgi:hypothetical protein
MGVISHDGQRLLIAALNTGHPPNPMAPKSPQIRVTDRSRRRGMLGGPAELPLTANGQIADKAHLADCGLRSSRPVTGKASAR